MSPKTIAEIYAAFTDQAPAWAIASTSTGALASDIADIIGAETTTGYPTDGAGNVDLYALAAQVQSMAGERERKEAEARQDGRTAAFTRLCVCMPAQKALQSPGAIL